MAYLDCVEVPGIGLCGIGAIIIRGDPPEVTRVSAEGVLVVDEEATARLRTTHGRPEHETWCATHVGGCCDCTLPDGHPLKEGHERDKAFCRGAHWTDADVAGLRTTGCPGVSINRVGDA